MPTFQQYWDMGIGLRAGTEAKNAAYAMTDLDDTGRTLLEIYRWVQIDGSDPELTIIWNQRVQNTLCKIASLTLEGDMNILIVTRAGVGVGGGDRYGNPGAPCAVGDGLTFKKTNLLPSDSQILDQGTFSSDLAGVDRAAGWVHMFLGR